MIMKKFSYLVLLIIVGLSLAYCSPHTKKGLGEVNIVLKPKEVVVNDGFYILNSETKIVADAGNDEVASIANYLVGTFIPATGYSLMG